MKSFKAVAVGCLFIIVVGLMLQLAYIFLAVGYLELAKSFPFLKEINGDWYRYLLGVPVFFMLMFTGGYITAAIIVKRPVLHSAMVGAIITSATMFGAIEQYEMTLSGIFVFGIAFASVVAGGWFWQKRQFSNA